MSLSRESEKCLTAARFDLAAVKHFSLSRLRDISHLSDETGCSGNLFEVKTIYIYM